MQRTLPLLLALTCLLATVQGATAQPVDIYSRPRKAERSRTYDALHYRIQLRFDEASKSFWGENTITLTPLRDGFILRRFVLCFDDGVGHESLVMGHWLITHDP